MFGPKNKVWPKINFWQKFLWSKKFWLKKIFCSKNFYSKKNFVGKSFLWKKFWSKNVFGPKKFLINFWQKIFFELKNCLAEKKLFVSIFFFGRKKFSVEEKPFGQKNFLVLISFCAKQNFWSTKRFWSTTPPPFAKFFAKIIYFPFDPFPKSVC